MANLIQLPKELPNVEIGNPEFESGFDEECVDGGLKSNYLICTICEGLPRKPVSLKLCGHLFCEGCMRSYIESHRRVFIIPCPVCKKQFKIHKHLQPFGSFQQWAQGIYKSIQVKCAYCAEYKGNVQDVDEHQRYLCKMRRIKCPNDGCTFIDAENQMGDHVAKCPNLARHCPGCFLPVMECEEKDHICHTKLISTVKGIFKILELFMFSL